MVQTRPLDGVDGLRTSPNLPTTVDTKLPLLTSFPQEIPWNPKLKMYRR